MNKDAKLFVFLVAIGFTSAMMLSLIPWGLLVQCMEKGMVPDLSSREPNCVEIGTPNAFGFNDKHSLTNYVGYGND